LSYLFELNDSDRLKRHESSRLEYKEAFSLSNLADYARDFAAFANNKGGYMVFGVKNAPHEVLGLKTDAFHNFDQAVITESLNSIFSQSISIEKLEYELKGQQVGVLYIAEARDKPVIAKKNQASIKEADVYYRYDARTERIRYAELKYILEENVTKEKNAWMDLIKNAVKIGATNSAILDTVEGDIHIRDDRVVVLDDDLIEKLKFIKEGSFKETSGDPTLKLVGNLVPATVIKKGYKTVPKDLYTLNAKMVAKSVAAKTNKRFRPQPEHVWAWKYYKIRPLPNDPNPDKTVKKYCDYKAALNVYLYTQDWIDFLVGELTDDKKYKAFIAAKGKNPAVTK